MASPARLDSGIPFVASWRCGFVAARRVLAHPRRRRALMNLDVSKFAFHSARRPLGPSGPLPPLRASVPSCLSASVPPAITPRHEPETRKNSGCSGKFNLNFLFSTPQCHMADAHQPAPPCLRASVPSCLCSPLNPSIPQSLNPLIPPLKAAASPPALRQSPASADTSTPPPSAPSRGRRVRGGRRSRRGAAGRARRRRGRWSARS